jgi:hypothetical protein
LHNNINIKNFGLLGTTEVVTNFRLSFARKGCICFFVQPRCCQRKVGKTFSYLKFLHRHLNTVSRQYFIHELQLGGPGLKALQLVSLQQRILLIVSCIQWTDISTMWIRIARTTEEEHCGQWQSRLLYTFHPDTCTKTDVTDRFTLSYFAYQSFIPRRSTLLSDTRYSAQKNLQMFPIFILLPVTYIYVLWMFNVFFSLGLDGYRLFNDAVSFAVVLFHKVTWEKIECGKFERMRQKAVQSRPTIPPLQNGTEEDHENLLTE